MIKAKKWKYGLLAGMIACAAIGFASCGGTVDDGQTGETPMLVGPQAISATPTTVETYVNSSFSLNLRYNWGDFDVIGALNTEGAPQPDFNIRWESSVLGAVEFQSQDMYDENSDIVYFNVGNYAGTVTLTGTSAANPMATTSVEVVIRSDGGLGGDYQPCEEEKLELELVGDHYVVTGLGEYQLGSVEMGTYWNEPNALIIIGQPYGIPITEIADDAFDGNTDITHFESSTVTKIGDRAFEGCTSLTTIYLEENIEIGDYAFKGCENFTKAIIRSVKSIGEYAFANLTNFNNVMGGAGDLRLQYVDNAFIGAHAFENCTAFTYMDGGGTGLTIGEYAFAGCTGLENVSNFGAGTIGSYAFDGCVNLGRANSGLSAEKVMPYAFNGCIAMNSFHAYKQAEIMENAFATCKNLSSVSFAEGVTKIGANAFADCANLSDVISYASVGVIEENAFKGCIKLCQFRVDGSVGEVKAGAFERAGTEVASSRYKYLSYQVSEGTKIFRTDSFKNAALQEIDLSKSETIEVYSFRTCTGEVSIVLPSWMTEIPAKMFAGFMGMVNLTFAPNTTSIGEEAFFNCSVETLVLPTTIVNVGVRAFAASELKKLTVETLDTPNNTYELVVFEDGAFRDCKSLEEISLEGWMSSRPKIAFGLMENCFSGCTALKTVNLGNVNAIRAYAFANVRSLKSFTFVPWKSDTTPVGMSLHSTVEGVSDTFFYSSEIADATLMANALNSGNYDSYSWTIK